LRERNFIQEGAIGFFRFLVARQTGEQAFSFGSNRDSDLPCADLASFTIPAFSNNR